MARNDLQRQSAGVTSILQLQRTIGNRFVQRMLRADTEGPDVHSTRPASPRSDQQHSHTPIHPLAARAIPTKLAITKPRDAYEQQADRMAKEVVRNPEPKLKPESQPPQPVPAGAVGHTELPSTVHDVLRSSGQPLDRATRSFMEARFGCDFSGVRVHRGGVAEESARAMHANAYTVDQSIVFGANQFAPGTPQGRQLITHELTHVVQQDSSGPMLSRSPDDKEAATIGSEIEPSELKEWKATLEAQGYEVFTRKEFDRVEWLSKAFSDKRARPDLIAINRARRNILVGDVTAGPWSQAALKPGDIAKLPRDIGAEPETKHHLEKTMEDARQAHRNLPEDLKGFRVSARDRWWKQGGYSREVVVARGTPAPKSRPGGGQVRLPPSTPPKTPTKAAGPSPAKTTPAGATPAKSPGAGKLTEEVGAPIEPVREATPGYQPAKGAAIGGAIQMIQAMQIAGLQRNEVEKFQARYAQLQPKIDAYLAKGFLVELILIVEKPDIPDLGCRAGVFCDQGQLIYFHDFYINYVANAKPDLKPAAPSRYPTMGPAGGRSGGHVPYVHEGGRDIEEKQIRFRRANHPDHHCEYMKQTLYPEESPFPLSPIEPRRRAAQPEKPKPPTDPATRKVLALLPARVYVESANIIQAKVADEVVKALAGNPLFGEVKSDLGGGLGNKYTRVSYRNPLDKAKAEALAAIIRTKGVPTATAELSGNGDDDPGVLTIWFGSDAEK
jgi:uncharacterized protein DUF4157